MLTYRGGHKVPKGTYWNLSRGDRVDMTGDSTLPGDSGTLFVKMAPAAILLAGPVIGLLFAVFLPFIGIAMTLYLIGRKLAVRAVQVAVKSTTFGWKPIEVYLDGKQRRIKDPRGSETIRKA